MQVTGIYDVQDVTLSELGVVWAVSSAGVSYTSGSLATWTHTPGLPSGSCGSRITPIHQPYPPFLLSPHLPHPSNLHSTVVTTAHV